jgi:signal transduction histidine kinase
MEYGRRQRRSPANGSAGDAGRFTLVTVVVLVCLVATVVAGLWYYFGSNRRAAELLAVRGTTLSVAVEAAIGESVDQAASVAAFFESSQEVTFDEYTGFIGDLRQDSAVLGIAFVAPVPLADLDAYEASMQEVYSGYHVYTHELYGAEGLEHLTVASDVYYPIQYFVAEDGIWAPEGFDLGADGERRARMERSLETGEPSATAAGWFVGTDQQDIVLLMWPVIRDNGVRQGLVVAAADMSGLVDAAAPASLRDSIDWSVWDLDGADTTAIGGADGRWAAVIPVLDRGWVVEVTSTTAAWSLLTLMVILIAGVVGSLLAGYGTHLVRHRIRGRRELERLRAVNRQKDHFLAAVSHSLRTPLTSILGFAQELTSRPGDFDAAERAELLTYISDEARSMESAVQDLLVVAHLEEGGSVAVRREYLRDVAGRVRRVVAQHPTARYAAVSVSGNAAVWADGNRLGQVTRNLIDNAVVHGDPPVEVSISSDNTYVRVVVRDHGPGVPEQAVEGLFDRYDTGPDKAGMPASAGLGLSVARQLARMMGGDLRYLGGEGGASFELILLAADGSEAVEAERTAIETSMAS